MAEPSGDAALVDGKKMNKSRRRYRQFALLAQEFCPGAGSGPLLDCGCGLGYFTLTALK